MHSLSQVFWGPLVADLQALSACDLSVIRSCVRLQLEHRSRTGRHDLAAEPDQLDVPWLEHVPALLPGSDLLEEAVPLLEHSLESRQSAGVARLNLHQHLVQKPASLLWAGLHEAEIVRPEQGDPEAPGKIESPAAHAVNFYHSPRAVALERQGDGELGFESRPFDVRLDTRHRGDR